MAKRPSQKSSAPGASRLKPSDFAYPKARKYPINTKSRARAALSYAARDDTAGSYPTVAKAVRKKWGNAIESVGPAKGKVSGPGTRKR